MNKNSKLSKTSRLQRRKIHSAFSFFFLILSFLAPKEILGQGAENKEEKHLWFDTMIGGTNSGIFKGVLYDNEFRVINERHQFFGNKIFQIGSVNYYGQHYFNILLKYDVYLDDLVVVNNELANRPIMIFDKEGVSDFTIEGNSFEQIFSSSDSNVKLGFYQVLLKRDSLTLYKKLRKKIFKRTGEQAVYYEFKDRYSYLLYLGNVYYPFKKLTELNRFFSKDRKEIKAISKKHRALKKSNSDAYMKSVLSDLFQVKTTSKQKDL